jgi:Arc/MetJ family transcription regulator
VRTNIVIDDALMARVLKLTGFKTKREAVEAGLKLLERMKRQERVRGARGRLRWEGVLDAMRSDR